MGFRFLVDYRLVNKRILPDRFPMANINNALHILSDAKYLTSFDLSSGFFQIPIDRASREKTSFITTKGHYQFKYLPMGMKNSSAAFQRAMSELFEEELGVNLALFLDDIIICSPDWNSHLKNVENVLKKLKQKGFTINPQK